MKMTRKMLPASRSFAVVCAQARRGIALRRCATALLLAGISGSAFSAPQGLLKPAQLIVDNGLPLPHALPMNMSPGNTPRSGIPVMKRWPGRRWRGILSIKRPRKGADKGRKARSSPPERFVRRCRIYAVMSNK